MSLINHQHKYKIYVDNFVANALTVSGVSYSKRHFEMVKATHGSEAAGHVALGILELLPVVGAIIAIFERIIMSKDVDRPPTVPPNPPPQPPPLPLIPVPRPQPPITDPLPQPKPIPQPPPPPVIPLPQPKPLINIYLSPKPIEQPSPPVIHNEPALPIKPQVEAHSGLELILVNEQAQVPQINQMNPQEAKKFKVLLHPDKYLINQDLLKKRGIFTKEQAEDLFTQINNGQVAATNQPLLHLTDKVEEELNTIPSPSNTLKYDDFVLLPHPTPPSMGLAWNHWTNLRKIGQVVAGDYEPIINFLLNSMPGEIKTPFLKANDTFSWVLHSLEKNRSDQETILFQYQKFLEEQDWSYAAGSEGASAIGKHQVFFLFYQAYLLEQVIKNRTDPKAISQLQKMAASAIVKARELLKAKIKNSQKVAKVKVRKMGGISTKENNWIQKRLDKVLESQKVLFNDDSLSEPLRIGLCLSGGGFRATTLASGYMTALQKLGIVDSSLYVSGLSGSTWYLVSWLLSNKKPEECQKMLEKIFPNANVPSFLNNIDKLDVSRFLYDVVLPKAISGKPISSVDFYGGLLSRALLMENHGDSRHELTMDDIKKCIKEAKYPFPIFTSISETNLGTNAGKWYNWFEFNPYEVENDTLGLSIPACAFGSKFEEGVAETLSPETIGSLMAQWGSAYTVDLSNQIDEQLVGGSVVRTITDSIARLFLPTGLYDNGRVSPAQSHNPWYKLPPELWTQRFESQELADAVTTKEKCTYNDAGIDFNLPIIPLLKRMRDLDVVIVGDSSSGEITQEHKMPNEKTLCPQELGKFFEAVNRYGISYERFDPKSPLNFSVYIPKNPSKLRDPVWIEGEKLPIIIYFNFNTDKQMIERYKEDEKLGKLIGEHNLESFDAVESLSGFANTFNFEYQSKEFAQLAAVGEFNILSHQEDIMEILKMALKRRSELSHN